MKDELITVKLSPGEIVELQGMVNKKLEWAQDRSKEIPKLEELKRILENARFPRSEREER